MKDLIGTILIFLVVIAFIGGFIYLARNLFRAHGSGNAVEGYRRFVLWILGFLGGVALVGGIAGVMRINTENNTVLQLTGLGVGVSVAQFVVKKYGKK